MAMADEGEDEGEDGDEDGEDKAVEGGTVVPAVLVVGVLRCHGVIPRMIGGVPSKRPTANRTGTRVSLVVGGGPNTHATGQLNR